MAIYRDQVTRITLPMVRAWMRPAVFRQTPSVRLEKLGFAVDVKLERVANSTSYGGERVFFVCPRPSCGTRVNVLGCAMWIGWGCTKCLHWRGRNRRRIDMVPSSRGTHG